MIARLIQKFFWQEKMRADLFQQIADMGAASAPILQKEHCEQLVREINSREYPFAPELCEQGKDGAKVYQELETVANFPRNSSFTMIKDIFEMYLDVYANSLSPYPFTFEPRFNSVTLARYPKGSMGITPHLDHVKYKNLICIFILQGKGKFFLCDDRQGNGAREINASVGNIIFLRCPGFMGINKRPFHFLAGIDETRYSLVLRQEYAEYK